MNYSKNDDKADNEMLTVREVADYLRLSQATVYKWAKAKKIPAVRLGRNWRFSKLAVEAWVKREGEINSSIAV